MEITDDIAMEAELSALLLRLVLTAVVLTVGLGLGSQQEVGARISSLGSNLLIVSPGSLVEFYGGDARLGAAHGFDRARRWLDHHRLLELVLLVVFLDGVKPVGMYVHKASIRRDDAIDASSDDFVEPGSSEEFRPVTMEGECAA